MADLDDAIAEIEMRELAARLRRNPGEVNPEWHLPPPPHKQGEG